MQLFNGNCFDILPTLEDNSVDMVCIDPPYGTTTIGWDKVFDFEQMWKEIERVSKKDANIIIFGSQPFSSLLIASLDGARLIVHDVTKVEQSSIDKTKNNLFFFILVFSLTKLILLIKIYLYNKISFFYKKMTK
jgi:DNA modification methylase